MKLHFFTVFLLFILMIGACKKEELDPERNPIFRCKVNGKNWKNTTIPQGLFGFGVQGSTDIMYYEDTGYFSMWAIRRTEDEKVDQGMTMLVRRNVRKGYNGKLSSQYSGFHDQKKLSGCRVYALDTTKVSRLHILNIDTENYLIEGSFEFSAFNKCGDTVYVQDGYFHRSYRF